MKNELMQSIVEMGRTDISETVKSWEGEGKSNLDIVERLTEINHNLMKTI